MMLQSVFAAVDGGYHNADHLALYPGQWRFAVHQSLVEMHVIDKRRRMQAVDLHDVIDLAAFGVSGAAISSFSSPVASASGTVSIQATGLRSSYSSRSSFPSNQASTKRETLSFQARYNGAEKR